MAKHPVLLLPHSPLASSSAQQREDLLWLLVNLSYREGSFTLSSGQESSFYINCKPVALHPQGAFLIGSLMLASLPANTQAVAGMTLGADPLVTSVSLASVYAQIQHSQVQPAPSLTNLPALIVRKQAKGHGTQAWLEGPTLDPGTCVWVLEDVVTTGGSALLAAERIRDAGYQVGGILTLVDRLEGGSQRYEQAGILFRSIFTLPDLQAAKQKFKL